MTPAALPCHFQLTCVTIAKQTPPVFDDEILQAKTVTIWLAGMLAASCGIECIVKRLSRRMTDSASVAN